MAPSCGRRAGRLPLRAALLTLVTLAAVAQAPAASAASPVPDLLERTVTVDRVFRHLDVLQRITDSSGGNRAAGTVGFARSAEYVVDQLTRAGYRVTRQPVPYQDFAVDAETGAQLEPVARPLRVMVMQYSPSTPVGGIDAPVVAAPTQRDGQPVDAPGCTPEDYAGLPVVGAVVLAPRASCGFLRQQQIAADLGAAAFLTYVPTPSPDNIYRLRVFQSDQARIPMGTLSQRQAEDLAAQSRQGTVRLHLELRGHVVHGVTENILAETWGGDPAHVVMAGAHLDSVPDGPGINDNATAVAVLLETALRLAPVQGQVRNKVRFAFWGAEELIVVGSQHYVSQLTDQERRSIAYYLNFELIAASNYGTFVMHVADAPPPGTERIEQAFAGYFIRRGLPYELQDSTRVGSDHEPFLAVGIPVGGLQGAEFSVKTPEQAARYGGTAGQLLDPCYHQTCDRASSVNRTALDRHGRAMAWVIGDLAVTG